MAWLEEHAPYPSIRRAMQEGTAELLGAFLRPPGLGEVIWMVKVTSRHDRIWHVTFRFNGTTHKYQCGVGNEPLWEHWYGENQTHEIFTGDNPQKYKELKENAKTKN